MSLRFCFGPSGSGKSHRIYEEIMQRAAEEPGRNFLIIVPDQFTMQTQKDLVMRSDRDGILNIDVLSFGRLSHRILEEVGTKEMPVLDDTGKSLVLQKVAADLKEQLLFTIHFIRILSHSNGHGNDGLCAHAHQFLDQPVLYGSKSRKAVKHHYTAL